MGMLDVLSRRVAVSELGDKSCRDLLRSIVQRHGSYIYQREEQLRKQPKPPEVEIIKEKPSGLLKK